MNKESHRRNTDRAKKASYLVGWALLLWSIFIAPEPIPEALVLPAKRALEQITWYYLILLTAAAAITAGLVFGLWRTFLWMLGFALYPLRLILVLMWRFGKNSLALLIGQSSIVIRVLKSWRFRLISVLLFWVASLICVEVERSSALLVVAGVVLIVLMSLQLFRRVYTVHSPLSLVESAAAGLGSGWQKAKREAVEKLRRIWSLEEGAEAEERKLAELTSFVFHHAIFTFLARLLAGRVAAMMLVSYFLTLVLYTFGTIVVGFAFIFHAAAKVDPIGFSTAQVDSAVGALTTSFCTILGSDLCGFTPDSDLARALICIQMCFGLAIGVILFLIFTAVTVERFNAGADSLVNLLEDEKSALSKAAEDITGRSYRDLLSEVTEPRRDASQRVMLRILSVLYPNEQMQNNNSAQS